MSWELKGKYPKIFDDSKLGSRARELFDDAQKLLHQIVADKRVTANAVYGFFPANPRETTPLFTRTNREPPNESPFQALRQRWERDGQTSFRSLADYIAPQETGLRDYLGVFAVTAGLELESLVDQFERDHDDYNSIMSKALADRLAEGLAEMLHKKAREDWGYGRDERLTIDDLIEEKYQGIRPASGYPSSPDHTEKPRPVATSRRGEGSPDCFDRIVCHVSRRLG